MPAVNDFDTEEPATIETPQLQHQLPVTNGKPLQVTKLCNDSIMLFNANCFDVLPHLKANIVDMVFADLPYGTTQNKWDSVLPLDQLWSQLLRIGQSATPYVFTAQTPFDKVLGCSNLDMLKYEWIWRKEKGTGHLNSKKQPLRNHENVLVFYGLQCTYNPQFTVGTPYNGNARVGKKQQTTNYGTYNAIREDNAGIRYPKTIIQFTTVGRGGKHPTQKPVELLEYLIKTYTNECDLVLDPTMGSGTTAVACKHLNRRCIGIELDQQYFNIAVNRVINE